MSKETPDPVTPNEIQWLREALQNREKEFERVFLEMRTEIYKLTKEKETYRQLYQGAKRRLDEMEFQMLEAMPDSVTSGGI